GVSGNYIIKANELTSFNKVIPLYLEDLLEGTIINLRITPEYSFTANINDLPDRFLLHFSNNEFPYNEDVNTNPDGINIYSYENTIYVNLLSAGEEVSGEIAVYNLLGQEIKRKTIEREALNKINMYNYNGQYIVKVFMNDNIISGKIFIK
ncbi:MAG: T9SS type A sorting domain-containing protein, partial [Bacteroidales bacterium]|nr:T9SS type A sorting domain-containing protein [Bacteroidales bacterium]